MIIIGKKNRDRVFGAIPRFKSSSRIFLIKRPSENMQQIYRRKSTLYQIFPLINLLNPVP